MSIRFLSLPVALLSVLCVFNTSQAAVVAHWEFEPGANFLNDSSGNGYNFVDPGIVGFATPTSSTDKPATSSVTGSGQFDGTSSFTTTAIPLSLNIYGAVRFSYWMKVETTTSQIMLFENSFDTNFKVNAGSTFHLLNYNGAGELIAYRTNGVGFPSEATTLDYGSYNTLDEWHFVQVDYDFTQPVADDRVKIQIDGVAGTKVRSIPGEPTNVWSRLRDDFLYVGGRREFSGNPDLLFSGKIADFTIEGFSPSLSGDYNNNGVADAADYVAWRKNEGTTNFLPNDQIGGMIGQAQYDHWRTNFGKTLPGGSGLATAYVPEPSSLVLSVVCCAVMSISSRSRRMRCGVC